MTAFPYSPEKSPPKPQVIAIVNAKGGVGKSFLSCSIAGYFANAVKETPHKRIYLSDLDRSQCSAHWLQVRKESTTARMPLAPIYPWVPFATESVRGGVVTKGLSLPEADENGAPHRIIFDTPAGLREEGLLRVLSVADRVIVPVSPGAEVEQGTVPYILHDLLPQVQRLGDRGHAVKVCWVGNNMEVHTRLSERLHTLLLNRLMPGEDGGGDNDAARRPLLDHPANIKRSQSFSLLMAHGQSIFDVRAHRAQITQPLDAGEWREEIAPWRGLATWLMMD